LSRNLRTSENDHLHIYSPWVGCASSISLRKTIRVVRDELKSYFFLLVSFNVMSEETRGQRFGILVWFIGPACPETSRRLPTLFWGPRVSFLHGSTRGRCPSWRSSYFVQLDLLHPCFHNSAILLLPSFVDFFMS
jgi:hypothetical protein